MALSPEIITKQKELLLKEKDRLESDIKNLDKYPDYDGIGDDVTQQLVDFENNASIEDQLKFLLKKVKVALRAIEDGTYGVCKKCGEAIESGRLEILPYAELCVTCKPKR